MAKASKGSIRSKIDNLLQSSRETTESPATCTAVHFQDSQELLPQVQDDGELQDPLVLSYSGDTSPILESLALENRLFSNNPPSRWLFGHSDLALECPSSRHGSTTRPQTSHILAERKGCKGDHRIRSKPGKQPGVKT